MSLCFFISDLHGHVDRYEKLFSAIVQERPSGVFFGGDLLPTRSTLPGENTPPIKNFVKRYLVQRLRELKASLGETYPRMFMILGNDDIRTEEAGIVEGMSEGGWEYVHGRKAQFGQHLVFGYACVPPTPFMLKDWERYDVSRYVDPGCVAPEEGWFSNRPSDYDLEFGTIQKDLEQLARNEDLTRAIFLFHSPPYQTNLDRADLDGRKIDHVPVDVHVGSIAIRRFIEERQPTLTLHGHIHESVGITGSWYDRIGDTYCFSAAHDGRELALIRFDLDNLEDASRELI